MGTYEGINGVTEVVVDEEGRQLPEVDRVVSTDRTPEPKTEVIFFRETDGQLAINGVAGWQAKSEKVSS